MRTTFAPVPHLISIHRRDLHKRSHTRHPIGRQSEQIPEPRQRDPRIGPHRRRVGQRSGLLLVRQRHAPLVRVDGVRGAAHPHDGQRLHGGRCCDGEVATYRHHDCACGAEDAGPGCWRVVGFVEEVWGAEDLRVPVVGAAAGAAEAAAAGHHGGVGEQEGGGAGGFVGHQLSILEWRPGALGIVVAKSITAASSVSKSERSAEKHETLSKFL